MSITTPDRIVELWPSLPQEARQQIVEIAESSVAGEAELELTPEEEVLLEQAREDFRLERVLSAKEYHAEMDLFMKELAATFKS